MTKIVFTHEEWWPILEIQRDPTAPQNGWSEDETVDVPEELLQRWEKCLKEFNEIQTIFANIEHEA